MNSLDDLGNEILKTASDALGKVKEVTEVVKLKDTISGEERKISGYYQEIGKLFYDSNPDNSDELYKTLFENVKISEKQIEECQDRIFEIKKVIQCKQCGEKMPYAAKYCSNCAAEMVKPPVSQPESEEEEVQPVADVVEEAVQPVAGVVEEVVQPVAEAVEEAVQPVAEAVEEVVQPVE